MTTTREARAAAINMGLGSTAAPLVQQIWNLEGTVRALTERLDALEQAQKSSVPIHLAKVERRG